MFGTRFVGFQLYFDVYISRRFRNGKKLLMKLSLFAFIIFRYGENIHVKLYQSVITAMESHSIV